MLKGVKVNKIGWKYSRLTVIALHERGNKTRSAKWLCRCDCGNERIVTATNLTNGHTRSCRCIRIRHGMVNTREYHTWQTMLQRCLNPNNTNYPRYGGRGIKVCKRWLKFENFFKDMGIRPKNKTLERKNNGGNYTPKNCKWASISEQNKNCRCKIMLTYNRRKLKVSEFAKELGVNTSAIYRRLGYGWSVQKIANTPNRQAIKKEIQKRKVYATS